MSQEASAPPATPAPPGWLAHQLAFDIPTTARSFRNRVQEAVAMGYKGFTIVPATFMHHAGLTPEAVASIATTENVTIQVCGFLPPKLGFNLTTNEGQEAALVNLRTQAGYALALHRAGRGPQHIVGPMDGEWRGEQQKSAEEYLEWLDKLNGLGQELNLNLAIETLNDRESSLRLEDPCQFISWMIGTEAYRARWSRLRVHWDTGHMASKLGSRQFQIFAACAAFDLIAYFELVSEGREAFTTPGGVDMVKYITWFKSNLDSINFICGVEPFDYEGVTIPFGLGVDDDGLGVVTSRQDGVNMLLEHRRFLASKGLMRTPAE